MITEKLNNYIIDSDEIIGDVEYIHEFYSTFLKNERDIIIWLPPSYSESNKKYPVVYMHDGQNLFDPNTSFIGYDWKVDEVVSRLIAENLIKEVIIVGIYNTKDRLEEYNLFSEKGRKYASFLIKELKVFIDENFRTSTKYSDTCLMGSSMGGLISFQLFWNFPHIFGKAACMSNSFWIDDGKVFNMVEENIPDFNISNMLYIDCGSEEKELFPDFEKMVEKLALFKKKGILNYGSYIDEGSRHNEYDWSKRLYIPFRYMFEKTINNMP